MDFAEVVGDEREGVEEDEEGGGAGGGGGGGDWTPLLPRGMGEV